ncbi:anti-sigma regulatory factor (Ser/Thr protein kinase) [Lentzea atacamensis]|uniref:Anti-sigma regulatory factor (Ser/Thr protein kinase) n=1 Tax=Lentzea atacamensis TaxID=531938 RepID=A0ABX9E175_9PSEU|nr:ATP-binding protein [Lentzea atacamensis]RAS62273.1 anti-sigma regulatory factor (Ser/Thr protein kinase) [Lentzea atacamensis]
MKIKTENLAGVVVATPEGRLDLASYVSLRDGILKVAADAPLALVIRLGAGFEAPSRTMLSVFTTVCMKVSQWPDIPVVILAETREHRDELCTSGVTRFVRTAPDLEGALKAVEQPPQRRFRRIPLPCSPTAPTMARAAVREACELWGLGRLTDDAVLVVSELVENAVRHARSESVLRVELRPTGLSLAVRDNDPAPPLLESPGPDVPGHRGVLLVSRISVAWGWAPSSDGGKIVWAVLGLHRGE